MKIQGFSTVAVHRARNECEIKMEGAEAGDKFSISTPSEWLNRGTGGGWIGLGLGEGTVYGKKSTRNNMKWWKAIKR